MAPRRSLVKFAELRPAVPLARGSRSCRWGCSTAPPTVPPRRGGPASRKGPRTLPWAFSFRKSPQNARKLGRPPDARHRRKPPQLDVTQKQLNTTENRGVPGSSPGLAIGKARRSGRLIGPARRPLGHAAPHARSRPRRDRAARSRASSAASERAASVEAKWGISTSASALPRRFGARGIVAGCTHRSTI
jgi:hypothetical protein